MLDENTIKDPRKALRMVNKPHIILGKLRQLHIRTLLKDYSLHNNRITIAIILVVL